MKKITRLKKWRLIIGDTADYIEGYDYDSNDLRLKRSSKIIQFNRKNRIIRDCKDRFWQIMPEDMDTKEVSNEYS